MWNNHKPNMTYIQKIKTWSKIYSKSKTWTMQIRLWKWYIREQTWLEKISNECFKNSKLDSLKHMEGLNLWFNWLLIQLIAKILKVVTSLTKLKKLKPIKKKKGISSSFVICIMKLSLKGRFSLVILFSFIISMIWRNTLIME